MNDKPTYDIERRYYGDDDRIAQAWALILDKIARGELPRPEGEVSERLFIRTRQQSAPGEGRDD